MRSSIRRLLLVIFRGIPVASAATLGIAVVLVAGTQVGISAAASFTWSGVTSVPLTLPANAGSEPKARFDWGTCPTTGSCAGVGVYTDEQGNEQALAATRAGGSWGPASEIALPAGAATSGQTAGFGFDEATVACTGPGVCVAVGHYTTEGGGEEAMAVTEAGGVWGPASQIAAPANVAVNPEAHLRSIACAASGSCVAGGEYHNENGHQEALIAAETSGSWSQASALEPPANAAVNPRASVYSVACPAAGSCIAFGAYRNSATETEEAMVASETAGTWGQASQITLPANHGNQPRAELGSVVCAASGPCVAVGHYTDENGNEEAMVTEETGGSWSPASEIAPPANAASNPFAFFYVACPASGSCVAVGSYTDEGGDRQAMVAGETGSSWSSASELARPADAAKTELTFGELMCPAADSCLAFGQYRNNAGKTEDMEITGITAPENKVAPVVSGAATAGQALTCSEGTWTSSPTSYEYRWLRDGVAIGGAESSTYTVTAADEGHSISCEVTAKNAAGKTSMASANSVAVREEAREKREAEAAATKKHQEEEAAAAAKRKQEEEAAATAKKKREEEAKVAATGSVSLAGSIIRVPSDGRASVKLTCAGTATCSGRLTLTFRVKARKGKKAKVLTIGRGTFSIPAGKTATATLALNAIGRVLRTNHGKLSASLTILKSSPSPASTRHESVQLAAQRP